MQSHGLTSQPMTRIRVGCCGGGVRPSVGLSCYAILGEIWVLLLLLAGVYVESSLPFSMPLIPRNWLRGYCTRTVHYRSVEYPVVCGRDLLLLSGKAESIPLVPTAVIGNPSRFLPMDTRPCQQQHGQAPQPADMTEGAMESCHTRRV
jgi:hypothetical protein